MLPKNRIPAHPGEILSEEFLDPLGITQVQLAAHLGTSTNRVNEIVCGKRGVTPEMAWLLAQAFGTTPDFWINLQTNYDLARARPARSVHRIVRRSPRFSEHKKAGRKARVRRKREKPLVAT